MRGGLDDMGLCTYNRHRALELLLHDVEYHEKSFETLKSDIYFYVCTELPPPPSPPMLDFF